MKRNRVQCQKGLSLGKFLQRYGSEGPCEQAVFNARWPDGFRCPECGARRHCRIRSRKLWQCHACHRRTSLVAGTIFAATQLPLTVRLLAIHLLTQGQHGVSSLELARQLGVSRNTAWKMKHKLLQVMKESDERVPLGGIVQVDDAYWGGERTGGKRGRGAQDAVRRRRAGRRRRQAGKDAHEQRGQYGGLAQEDAGSMGRAALAARHGGAFRRLGLLPGRGRRRLRARADRHRRRAAELRGFPLRPGQFFWVNTMLGNVKQSLAGTCHALDGKHLPRYLAEFCYRFNRPYDLQVLVPRLRAHPAHALPPPNLG